VGGAANTMPTPLEALMTYNGDSTYSFTFAMNVTGKVSLLVILRNPGIVYGYYYNSNNLGGGVAATNITTTINENWGNGYITAARDDNVSADFRTYLRPNTTDSYTIYINIDDGADLYLGGVLKVNRFGVGGGTFSFTQTLTADTNYYLRILWQEITGSANIRLYWTYTGVITTTVPAPNLVWPEFVGSTVYTFTIACPAGYTSSDPSNPNE
jgi:hypothetical protein